MSAYNPPIGGAIISFFVSPTLTWAANTYLGLGPDGPSALKATVLAWPAPADGFVNNLVVQGLRRQTTGASIRILLCTSPSSITPSYPPTALSAEVLNNAGSGVDAENSFEVAQGDLVVAFITGTWPGGQAVSALWTPKTT